VIAADPDASNVGDGFIRFYSGSKSDLPGFGIGGVGQPLGKLDTYSTVYTVKYESQRQKVF
jgi:hypothetical protein